MECIETEITGSAGYIWLNRPQKRNALNRQTVEELYTALRDFGSNPDVRVVVIGGRGKAFCAGADLAYLQEMQQYTVLENSQDSQALARTLRAVWELPKPVIARVHGPAIAGGCGLATVCDIVLASPEASFGYTEVKIGFIPAIVMAFLLRKAPQMAVRELLLTGRVISAEAARECGLVTTLVGPPGEETLDEHLKILIQELSAASPSAIALTKAMLTGLDGMALDSALEYATRMNALARMTPDCRQGIAAFLERAR